MFGIRKLLGWGNDGDGELSDESVENWNEACSDEDEDDGLLTTDVLVRKEYSETVTREQVEIIWKDGTQSTKRWCDKWEKEDGDYVLWNSTRQFVWGSYNTRTKLRHDYEIELRIPEENVKALDPVDSKEWEATANGFSVKPLTLPEEDWDDFEKTTSKWDRVNETVEVTRIIMEPKTYAEYREKYSDE